MLLDQFKEQRELRDLLAQEAMADWAKWMLVATAVSTAIGLLSIYFIFRTFRQTNAAMSLQQQQLDLAKIEKEANEIRSNQQVIAEKDAANLNYAATQANYKLSLYDKRKAAFDRITRFSTTYKFAISKEQLDELKGAIFDARFVFPGELNDWLQWLLVNAELIELHEINIKAMQKMRNENPSMWTQELNDKLVNSSNEFLQAKGILHKELLSEALFERFEPFMGLPSRIEYDKVKSVKSTLEA